MWARCALRNLEAMCVKYLQRVSIFPEIVPSIGSCECYRIAITTLLFSAHVELRAANIHFRWHAKAKSDQEAIEDLASRATCTKPISRGVDKLTQLPGSCLKHLNFVTLEGLANMKTLYGCPRRVPSSVEIRPSGLRFGLLGLRLWPVIRGLQHTFGICELTPSHRQAIISPL